MSKDFKQIELTICDGCGAQEYEKGQPNGNWLIATGGSGWHPRRGVLYADREHFLERHYCQACGVRMAKALRREQP